MFYRMATDAENSAGALQENQHQNGPSEQVHLAQDQVSTQIHRLQITCH